jgi:hypothetical protein
MRFRSKMKKVTCSGYTVFVYRDPSDAFPLFLPDEAQQFKAGLKVLEYASAELSGANKTMADRLLVKINETNNSLQADFNAIYTVFATDPCRDRDYLKTKVDEIRRNRQHMEVLFAQIRAIEVAISNGSSATDVMPAIQQAFLATIPPAIRETVELVEQAPREVEKWRQP